MIPSVERTRRWQGDSSSVMVTCSGHLGRQHTQALANLCTRELEITHLAVPHPQPGLRGCRVEQEGLPRIMKYLGRKMPLEVPDPHSFSKQVLVARLLAKQFCPVEF